MTVVALCPHPDDVELGCWGALMGHRLSQQQVAIAHMCALKQQHAERRLEAAQAAQMIGAHELWWSYLEDELPVNGDTCALLDNLCREFKISRIYAPSPFDTNQDHVAAARLAMQQARNSVEVVFYETPTTTPEFAPNMYVRLSNEDYYAKVEAVKRHQTQLERRVDLLRWTGITAQRRAIEGFPNREANFAEAYHAWRLLQW